MSLRRLSDSIDAVQKLGKAPLVTERACPDDKLQRIVFRIALDHRDDRRVEVSRIHLGEELARGKERMLGSIDRRRAGSRFASRVHGSN